MTYRVSWAVLAVACCVPAAPGQSASVTLAVIGEADREGKSVTMKQQVTEMVPVTQEIQVVVNNQVQKQQRTVYVPQTVQKAQKVSLGEVFPYTGDGKRLGEDEAWERLRPGAVVILGGADLLQPNLRQVFRPDALLLLRR